jgi:large subunit ribosomal protein L1
VRVIAFAQGEKAREAQSAGADVVGAEDLAKRIEGGWMEFDVAIATPDLMGQVGKLGRVLGPRGLMPNPKTGTVTFDVGKAVRDAKGGRVEFRVDKTAVIHTVVGKSSFTEQALVDNLGTVIDAINRARPAGVKGTYIRAAHLTSTQGPSVKLDLGATLALAGRGAA